jgi:hypothetical protein
MRLTLGCGYALHALEYLAARGDGRPATARDIAEARRAPRRFLLRPLKALVTAGLLRSMPGPGGGYRLGRPVARITLLEVAEAVDGPIRGGGAPRPGPLGRVRLPAGGGLPGRRRPGTPPAGQGPPLRPRRQEVDIGGPGGVAGDRRSRLRTLPAAGLTRRGVALSPAHVLPLPLFCNPSSRPRRAALSRAAGLSSRPTEGREMASRRRPLRPPGTRPFEGRRHV